MKMTVKILSVVLVAMMLVMTSAPVFATGFNPSGVITNITTAADSAGSNSSGGFEAIAGKVIAFIRNLAVIIGVILLSVIGIKFMLGSAEEKAEYKKSLIPLVVGIVVVMAATQIVSMIFSFVK